MKKRGQYKIMKGGKRPGLRRDEGKSQVKGNDMRRNQVT